MTLRFGGLLVLLRLGGFGSDAILGLPLLPLTAQDRCIDVLTIVGVVSLP